MYRYIIPFNHKKTTIVTIGTPQDLPNQFKMEEVARWICDNIKNFPENFDQLKLITDKEINFKTFYEGSNDKEYILMIESKDLISKSQLNSYQETCNQASTDQEDIFLFVYGSLKVNRMNKDLINFL